MSACALRKRPSRSMRRSIALAAAIDEARQYTPAEVQLLRAWFVYSEAPLPRLRADVVVRGLALQLERAG